MQRFAFRLFSILGSAAWHGKWKRGKLYSTADWIVNQHKIIARHDSCQNSILKLNVVLNVFIICPNVGASELLLPLIDDREGH